METESLLLNDGTSLLMENKDSVCLICNSVTPLQTSYSIFYTVLPQKGTLLCNSVEKVIKRAIDPDGSRSTVLCSRCFSFFDELETCEERCIQLRENIVSWFNSSCQIYGDLNTLVVDGIACQTDPVEEKLVELSVAAPPAPLEVPEFEHVHGDDPSKCACCPSFTSDAESDSAEPSKDDPEYIDDPRSMSTRSKMIGPLTKEAMRRLRRYRHQCQHCDRMFRRPSELQKHIMSHTGTKPYSCSKCNKKFATKQGASIHLLRQHGIEADISSIKEDTSGMEESKMETAEDAGALVQTVIGTENIEQEINAQEFNNSDNIADVFNSVPDDYDDDFEWKEDEDNADLAPEPQEDSVVKYEPELEFQHPVLKAEKRGRKAKNKQGEAVEGEEVANGDEKKEKSKKVGRNRGSRAFERYSMPAIHECDQCGKKWRTASELKSHIASHSNLRPFVCEICGQAYKMRKALDIHVGMHNGIHPYTCHVCNKSFTQKVGLQKHLPIHTGYTRFQCDLCGKRFIHHKSFNIHKMTHTGEKTIKCSICGLAVLSQSHLKRHYRVHTGERPYACEICGKRFAEKYNLNAHGRVHDPDSAVDGARKKIHRCQLCGVCYDKKHKLEDHLATTHNKLAEDRPASSVVLNDLQALTMSQTLHIL